MARKFREDFRFESRRIMRDCAGDLFAQYKRLPRGAHPENVHRARVAINKLRTIMREANDAIPAGKRRRLKVDLAWLKEQLAAPRDSQVMLERLESLGKPLLRRDLPGLNWIRDSIESDRDAGVKQLRQSATRKRFRRIGDDLKRFRRQLKKQPGARQERKLKTSETSARRVARMLKTHYNAFETARRTLVESFSSVHLHDLRKAGKKIRYTLSMFERQNKQLYARLAEPLDLLHDCLGAIHDIDVMIPHVERIVGLQCMAGGEESVDALESGAAWTIIQLERQRRDLMRKFYRLWYVLDSKAYAEKWAMAIRRKSGGRDKRKWTPAGAIDIVHAIHATGDGAS